MKKGEPGNPALLKALVEATGGVQAVKRRRIYQELLRGQVIVQVSGPPEDADGKVGLVVMRGEDGRTGLAVFTDVASLKSWKPDCSYFVAVPGMGLCEMANANGLDAMVINPGGASWEIDSDELQVLAEGKIPSPGREMERLVRWEVSAPEDPIPEDTVRWLQDTLRPLPEILCCYLFMMAFGSGRAELYLGVRLDLPVERYGEFLRQLDTRLKGSPPIGAGFRVGPITPDLLPGVERFGQLVFRR